MQFYCDLYGTDDPDFSYTDPPEWEPHGEFKNPMDEAEGPAVERLLEVAHMRPI